MCRFLLDKFKIISFFSKKINLYSYYHYLVHSVLSVYMQKGRNNSSLLYCNVLFHNCLFVHLFP